MAPKKRPHAEASSSSSFDHNRFPSLGKSTLFYEKFATRNIESEREVAEELHNKTVCRSLANREWYPLMKFDSQRIHTDLVREFYCNMEVLENGSVKTYLRGKWITISVSDITDFLNIPAEEGADYPIPDEFPEPIDYDAIATTLCRVPTHWPAGILLHGNLTAEYLFLNQFVCHNLEPRGHTSDVAQKNGYLLYCIGIGMRVNIPLVYLHVLVRTLTAKRNSLLPFGVFITEFLVFKKVPVRQNEPFVKAENLINARTISQSSAHVNPVQRAKGGHQEEEAAAAHVHREQPELHQRFDQLAAQFQVLSTRVDLGFTQVNAALADILA